MKTLLLFILFSIFFQAHGQIEISNWYVPDSVCFSLDETNAVNKSECLGKNRYQEAISCISDDEQRMQYYTYFKKTDSFEEPCILYDKNNIRLVNGDSIDIYLSAANGATSISTKHGYYLLGITRYGYGLAYNKIKDGAVVKKNVLICTDTLTEKLSAIRHANGEDWWILAHKLKSDSFVVYLYKESIDDFMFVNYQKIGSFFDVDQPGLYHNNGEVAVSSNGERVVYTQYNNFGFNAFNFDRCTGQLSNYINLTNLIFNKIVENLFEGGLIPCSFSPSGRFVYLGLGRSGFQSKNTLFQIDLWNLADSANCILKLDSLIDGAEIKQMELYHGKILMAFWYNKGYIGIINNPDVKGFGCQFNSKYFPLTNGDVTGLPNFACFAPPLLGYSNSAGRDTTITLGDTLQIGRPQQPNIIYRWETDPPAYISCADCPQPYVSPDTNTSYYVTLTDTTLPRESDCNFGRHKARVRIKKTVQREEPIAQPVFKLYPNPTQNNFTIAHSESTTVEIINLVGQTVYQTELKNAAETQISTENWPNGAYLCRFNTADGAFTRKVVVLR